MQDTLSTQSINAINLRTKNFLLTLRRIFNSVAAAKLDCVLQDIILGKGLVRKPDGVISSIKIYGKTNTYITATLSKQISLQRFERNKIFYEKPLWSCRRQHIGISPATIPTETILVGRYSETTLLLFYFWHQKINGHILKSVISLSNPCERSFVA